MENRVNRIFLIRHAESAGNVDKTVHLSMPDHAIPLSEKGELQATVAGEYLTKWLERHVRVPLEEKRFLRQNHVKPLPYVPEKLRVRLWASPYKRTRQTADAIAASLGNAGGRNWLESRAENILLCEQQFGLFDGIPDDELPTKYPDEYAHYKKCEDFEGRFWARFPMGESRFDVAKRVHQAFGTFQRDAERHNIQNLAIVCHGVTMRAIKMMWMHYTPEWFEEERNPGNCSIHLIQLNEYGDYEDKGCIFEGFSNKEIK